MRLTNQLFIIFQLISIGCFGQNYLSKCSFNHGYFQIDDSLNPSFIEDISITGPTSPFSKTTKLYSQHQKLSLSNGYVISFDKYNDSTILYKEFIKSSNLITDSILTYGEIVIDKSNYKIEEIFTSNSYGEDSAIYDTSYFLKAINNWNIYLKDNKYEQGNFSNGKKNGKWFVFNSFINQKDDFIISEKEYENNRLKSEIKVDLSEFGTLKEQEKIISTQWYFAGKITIKDELMIKNDYNIPMLFTTDSTKYNPRCPFYFSYIHLKKNNTYNSRKYFWCGTGVTKKDRFPVGKWEMNKIGFIKIDDVEFKIDYLTADMMILSVVN